MHLVDQAHARSWPLGVASAPRVPLESDASDEVLATTTVPLAPGVLVATSENAVESARDRLEVVERTRWSTSRGPILLARTLQAGEVELHGPAEPDVMGELSEILARISGGIVFVEGGWERRAFAAPGCCDAVILALSAGYSVTPERSAAAARYVVETFSSPPCAEASRVAWEEMASKGAAALVDKTGRIIGSLPPGLPDPIQALRAAGLDALGAVVLPTGLNDEFMIPLVRSPLGVSLVVRDATRLSVSPVYFKAWLKGGGRIEVVRSTRVIAVATNPVNPSGPDAEAEAFRDSVQKMLADIPVHDVVLDSPEQSRRPFWKLW